jgi:hypothetical protein
VFPTKNPALDSVKAEDGIGTITNQTNIAVDKDSVCGQNQKVCGF